MVDISNLGNIISWPFEILGDIIYFVSKYFLEFIIIAGAIGLLYWIFKSGVIERISEVINISKREDKKWKKEIQKLEN